MSYAQHRAWARDEILVKKVERMCYREMRAPLGIAPRTREPLSSTHMTAHMYWNFVKVHGGYLLSQLYSGEKLATLMSLLRISRLLMDVRIGPQHAQELAKEIKFFSSRLNSTLPFPVKTMMLHQLIFHLPGVAAYWGPTRSTHCFPFERSSARSRTRMLNQTESDRI